MPKFLILFTISLALLLSACGLVNEPRFRVPRTIVDQDTATMDAVTPDAEPEDGSDVVSEASTPDTGDACVPNCAGRVCGADGCGGSCGTCTMRPNSAQACTAAGQCEYTCNRMLGNCDGIALNGCETPLNTADNCGACGRTCTGATPMCDANVDRCVSGCAVGQTRCGMACVDTQSDLSHCGTCGMACAARANSAVTCGMGTCRYTCNAGFGDCDGNPANGCETPLNTASHCGACGTACSGAGAVCDGTRGGCVTGCTAGQTRCGTSCVNTQTAPAHCGGCGAACASTANAVASCAMGACGSVCNAGFGNCDGNAANGCETPLTSITHCGACGRACSYANGTAACTAGACALASCQTGFGNCDGNPANGCETALNTASHCGACGNPCTIANGTGRCGSGTCQVAGCSPGFLDCDGNPANGCEASLDSPSTCGSCSRSCSDSSICAMGRCILCPPENLRCGNMCLAVAFDPNNCGACGTVCPPSASNCVLGRCRATPACPPLQTLCPGMPSACCLLLPGATCQSRGLSLCMSVEP